MDLTDTERLIAALSALVVAFATFARAMKRGQSVDMPHTGPSDPPNETCPFCGALVSTNVVGSVVAHRNHQVFCPALAKDEGDA